MHGLLNQGSRCYSPPLSLCPFLLLQALCCKLLTLTCLTLHVQTENKMVELYLLLLTPFL